MPKNTQGGSSHKKFARKHNTAVINKNKLRISEDEGEIYAIVTKMLGNGMFHCHCLDDTVRLGHIRGKFSGRGKRDNFVEAGKWVLIGLREWDVPSVKTTSALIKTNNKMQQCDLLEIYSDIDKQRLREIVTENWQPLDNNDISKDKFTDQSNNDGFIFSTDRDIEREKIIEEMNSSTVEKITMKLSENTEQHEGEDEQVNVDDI
jgi:initiation factor 1A